jgi:aminopeptidase-like protein
MTLRDAIAAVDAEKAGAWMYERVREWYPICRSITGQGLRDTLARIQTLIPIEISSVPTGTPVFDWMIPNEWNIRDAYIRNSRGEKVVDFKQHNLHVMGYSTPVRAKMSLEELRPHLHVHAENPDWIPYRTSYYREDWGFCLSQRTLDAMEPGEYEVVIDSTLMPGVLNYGEYLLKGSARDEVLISAHACHPSLANDNLSGMALAVYLAKTLQGVRLRHSYRFLFAPGTIGAIAWLSKHEDHARKQVKHGLILACVGDGGPFQYKKSRRGDTHIDRTVEHVLTTSGHPHAIHPFVPYGYDERQYCSPGFDLPVGCFMRGGPGGYPEYHSSADNLEIVSPKNLAESLDQVLRVIEVLETDEEYINLKPLCEPQLGRRGLYSQTGGLAGRKAAEMALLWVLNYSDGHYTLLDIAIKSGIPYADVRLAADALIQAGLLLHASIIDE